MAACAVTLRSGPDSRRGAMSRDGSISVFASVLSRLSIRQCTKPCHVKPLHHVRERRGGCFNNGQGQYVGSNSGRYTRRNKNLTAAKCGALLCSAEDHNNAVAQGRKRAEMDEQGRGAWLALF